MNLVVNFSSPKWFASGFDETLHVKLGSYQHAIKAVGGFWSARIDLPLGILDAEDWIANGLGRHVETYVDAELVWSGFVNQIGLTSAFLNASRGPLLDVANKVDLQYTKRNSDETPPVAGTTTTTDTAEDTDSQNLYGIRWKVLSTGEMTETEAERIRDTFLEENKLPEMNKDMSNGTASAEGISLECVGYVQMLDWPYTDATAGTRDADDKITDVLGDDPELTWNTDNVEANTVQIEAYDDDNSLAWSSIQDVVAHGGTTDERWLFQILGDLEAHYKAAPTTLKYQILLSDSGIQIRTMEGGVVDPWRIEPGEWIFIADFLSGEEEPTNLSEDPRAMFIEEVGFSAPSGWTLRGGKIEKLPQILANMGLGGIGA